MNFEKLVEEFVKAVQVEKQHRVLIEYEGAGSLPIARACLQKIESLGAVADIRDIGEAEIAKIMKNATDHDLKARGERALLEMEGIQKYIKIFDNYDEGSALVSPSQRAKYTNLVVAGARDYRVENTNWLVLSAPTQGFADACGMSFADFSTFYERACLESYETAEAKESIEALRELMGEQHDVRITAKNTDLTLTTMGGGSSKACVGVRNRPDGEVYTAPILDSVNGYIEFAPSMYEGERFEKISLHFKDGVSVEAKAENDERTKALNIILDRDEGARRIGEFALGFNPHIFHPVGDILFDEKIGGNCHLASGGCYKSVADNGNYSVNHWDMVCIQRPEYGGGNIVFDGKLIRKDGEFVVPELEGLNPANLLG